MEAALEKACKDCGRVFPETRDYFGQFKNARGGRTVIGFRNTCRECMRDRSSAHARANPEQRRERMARRIERQDAETYSSSDVEFIRKELGDTCRYCSDPLKGGGEVDHLTAVARGGTSSRCNLTLACMPCNRAKLSKTLDEFLEWRIERSLPVREYVPSYERPDTATTSVQRRNFN